MDPDKALFSAKFVVLKFFLFLVIGFYLEVPLWGEFSMRTYNIYFCRKWEKKYLDTPIISGDKFWSLYLLFKYMLTLLLLSMTCPVLANSVDPDQLASEEANWSGSALFVIKYVNFYQTPGSNNLIGWKLEVGVAS